MVDHRAASAHRRPVPAAAWRIRVHAGIPGVARFVDARIQTIYGGTTEIMKTIIAKDLGI